MKRNKIYKYIVIGVLIVSFFSLFLYKTPYVAAFNATNLQCNGCNSCKGSISPIKPSYFEKLKLITQFKDCPTFKKAIDKINSKNESVDLLHPIVRFANISGYGIIAEIEYPIHGKDISDNITKFIGGVKLYSKDNNQPFKVYLMTGKTVNNNPVELDITNLSNASKGVLGIKNKRIVTINVKDLGETVVNENPDNLAGCIYAKLAARQDVVHCSEPFSFIASRHVICYAGPYRSLPGGDLIWVTIFT